MSVNTSDLRKHQQLDTLTEHRRGLNFVSELCLIFCVGTCTNKSTNRNYMQTQHKHLSFVDTGLGSVGIPRTSLPHAPQKHACVCVFESYDLLQLGWGERFCFLNIAEGSPRGRRGPSGAPRAAEGLQRAAVMPRRAAEAAAEPPRKGASKVRK